MRYLLVSVMTLLPALALSQSIDLKSRPLQAERSHDFDIKHYRIELRLKEQQKALEGITTITLAPLQEGLSRCELDAETFRVDSVADGQNQALRFDHQKGKLTVHLPRPSPYGEDFTLTVTYHGLNVDTDPTLYGMSAGYDLGLDFKEATEANPQLINTLSFPEGARHWFPCYDHPNDRATQEVIATVRDDYQVLSNGRLLSATDNLPERTKTFHWSQELPHPTYLFVLVAGPYEVIEDKLGDLPINYWVYRKDVPEAMRSFHKTPQIIDFFNRTYGYDYPWVKYDQITIPGIGGGAESTSATVLGQSTIHDFKADKDFPSHGLVAHEAAHQWWGNLVSYRDWSETWLSESFATYGEYLFSRHDLGEDEGAVNLLNKKNAYLREAKNRYMRPIVFERWRYPNDNFDSHTYPKGAAVLHMLRFVLGDRPFFETLQHFLHKHAFQPVTTEELKIAVKEASGQNLDWFFDQWIYRRGHPVFEITSGWDEVEKKVHMRIAQIQDTSTGVPVYRTPVIIGWQTASGRSQKKVWLQQAVEEISLETGDKPLLLRFDQGNHLLKEWTFEKTTDDLLYQLDHDDAIGKIWAAGELAKFATNREVKAALMKSASDDPFWAVRKAAIDSLVPVGDQDLPLFLQKISHEDSSSRVRAAALKQLASLKNPNLLKFFMDRFEKEDSYLAQAEAVRAIGNISDPIAREFLERAVDIKSPRQVIRRAAQEGLREHTED